MVRLLRADSSFMKKTRVILAILISSYSSVVLTEVCSTIRLDEKGGSLSRVPIYDQDNFGSCYAYTAAQMIDAYRFSHNMPSPNHLTSPLKISTEGALADHNYYTEDKGGGHVDKAIDFAKLSGSCNKKITDLLLSKRSENKFYDNAIKQFRKYLKEKKERSTLRSMIDYMLRNESPALKQIQCDLKFSGLPSNLIPNLVDLEKIIKGSYNWDTFYLNNLINKICEKDSIDISTLPKPITKDFYQISWEPEERSLRTQNVIEGLLNTKNPQPIGLSFCGSALANKNYTGVSFEYRDNDFCKPHAALIIGRKKSSSGNCMYLIRNSFGTGCELAKKAGIDCEEGTGQIWVDSARIGRATIGLSVFK